MDLLPHDLSGNRPDQRPRLAVPEASLTQPVPVRDGEKIDRRLTGCDRPCRTAAPVLVTGLTRSVSACRQTPSSSPAHCVVVKSMPAAAGDSSYGAQGTGHSDSPATSRMGTPAIGPVLPYLMGRPPMQFEYLWIGRCHRAAMGTDLVDRVLAGGPVNLIDTSSGRPDVGARRRDGAPVRRHVRGQQRRRAGQRCPSVRGAGRAMLRPDLRLIGHARPRVPASPCPCGGSASRGLVSHRQIGSGPLPASPLWPGCAPESSRVVQTRAARR